MFKGTITKWHVQKQTLKKHHDLKYAFDFSNNFGRHFALLTHISYKNTQVQNMCAKNAKI